MDALESEYSFLAPTWKLPSMATPSLYPSTYAQPYPHPLTKVGPTTSVWNHQRYIPPIVNHRTNTQQIQQPRQRQQQPNRHPTQSVPPSQMHQQPNEQYRNNENSERNYNSLMNFPSNDEYDAPTHQQHNSHSDQQNDFDRGLNHPPIQQTYQKRVQIVDPNRHTPSTDYISDHESYASYPNNNQPNETNVIQQKSKPIRERSDDNKSDSTNSHTQRSNNFKVHEYLYGLAVPDPGSYVSAYKNQQRRIHDEKNNPKSVMTQYKTFVQNGGFGPAFGNNDYKTYEEKLNVEKKKKNYSDVVRQANLYKVEEQKRIQNNGGPDRTRVNVNHVPKQRRSIDLRSNFLTPQEVREFERRIKREHDANCKCSLHAKQHQLTT